MVRGYILTPFLFLILSGYKYEHLEQSEQSEHSEHLEQSEHPEHLEQSEHSEHLKHLKQSEHLEQSEHSEHPEHSEQSEQSDQFFKLSRAACAAFSVLNRSMEHLLPLSSLTQFIILSFSVENIFQPCVNP